MGAERERIVSLQILRFVAVAMVVALHATCWTTFLPAATCDAAPIGIDNAGVDIFFVLSGFVITMTGPLANPRPSGAAFFWRRWRRVAPVYYLMSLPFIAAAIVAGKINSAQLIDTFAFWPAAGRSLVYPYLGSGWTLGFEMLFYSSVAAVLLNGRVLHNFVILAALAAAGGFLRLTFGWVPLRVIINPIFLEFGAGALLAGAWPRLRRAPLSLGVFLAGAAVCIFIAEAILRPAAEVVSLDVTLAGDGWARVLAFGAPAATLVAGAAILNRSLTGPVVAALAWLGDASYATYLAQAISVPVIGATYATLGVPQGLASRSAAFVLSIAAGAAVYVVIERPILRDLKRLDRVRWPWRSARAPR